MLNHIPVLKKEAIDSLNITIPGIYIDCTLGGGGYTRDIVNIINEKNLSNSKIISIDLDIDAISNYYKSVNADWEEIDIDKVKVFKAKFLNFEHFLVQDNFRNIKNILKVLSINTQSSINGIVADLGLNSEQLDHKLGLSFRNSEQKLSMQLDNRINTDARNIILDLRWKELAKLFRDYADTEYAEEIAKQIKFSIALISDINLITVGWLVDIINESIGEGLARKLDIHAKVFQALRIYTNQEFESLEMLLETGFEVLIPGGIFTIVSFHSGEDRIVKEFIKNNMKFLKVINKKPIIADTLEITNNSRARSGKLRAFQKIN